MKGTAAPAILDHLQSLADTTRDRILLRALKNAGKDVKYFPVDASQTLLEAASSGAEDDDFHGRCREWGGPKTDKGRSGEFPASPLDRCLLPGVGEDYREMP